MTTGERSETAWFRFEPSGGPTVLQASSASARWGDLPEVEGECQVVWRWRRNPGTWIGFRASTDVRTGFRMVTGDVKFDLPEQPLTQPDAADVWPELADGRGGSRTTALPAGVGLEVTTESTVGEIGSFTGVRLIEVVIVNLDSLGSSDVMEIEVDGWSIAFAPHPDDAAAQLKSEGGFGPTHLVRIQRVDGGVIEWDQYDEVTSALWHFLAFVGGRLPGLALPVAFDGSGRAVWTDWRCSTADAWAPNICWFDQLVLAGGLPALFEAWWVRWQDPFWRKVLSRATRMLMSANRTDPLDVAVTTAWTLLEVLAWAVLVIELGWLTRGDFEAMPKPAVLRLLLGWCGVDPAVPAQLVALERVRSGRSSLVDAAGAVGWVRNSLTHPPKKSDAWWPQAAEMSDAWRLETQWSELVMLKVLGYGGQFGTRCAVDGRRLGQVEPVPWA